MVLSGGTYSGNPLSAAAGLATLEKLDQQAFDRLDVLGDRIRHGINTIFRAAGEAAQASGDGSLFQIVPSDGAIDNYRSVPNDAPAQQWLERLHIGLLEAGVIISHRGLTCVSTVMDETVVDRCLDGFERAVAGMRD